MQRSPVLYHARASEEVLALVREAAPEDVEIRSLETGDAAEPMAKIADCEVAIQAQPCFPAALVAAAPRLRLVLHEGVGYQDTVDLPALRARNIRLAVTPEGTVVGVAEHTVMMMIGAFKHVIYADRETRAGRFPRAELRSRCRQLQGSRIGYIGMGRIAQEVAARLKAFGTRGIYHDTAGPLPPKREGTLGVRAASFGEVIETSDVVSVHVPLTETSRGLIGAAEIARMRPDAVLVCTSRGGIVDERALFDAMSAGHLLGAALDVFETEPLPAGHFLADLPNVMLTPHLAGSSRDALRQKMRAIFENYRRFRAGEPLRNEVML